MDYENDVFLSYKRDLYRDEWLIDHFVPLFWAMTREEIAAHCGRRPLKLFFDQVDLSEETRKFDQQGIEPGQDWRKALTGAISRSRCTVALWSPLYFFSEWCKVEWWSFRDRSIRTGKDLVVPIAVHDGEKFPDEARDAQLVILSDYVIVGEGFRRTERYVDFQDKLRNLARRVARVVASAPDFSNWPVAPFQDRPPAQPKIPQPRL